MTDCERVHSNRDELLERISSDSDALLSELAAAALLGISTRTLQAWRQRGGGPMFVRISSRCVRYRKRDLVAWSEARLKSNTSQPAATEVVELGGGK